MEQCCVVRVVKSLSPIVSAEAMFTQAIRDKYRVVRTQLGTGEEDAEYTIPLGRWRKGDGLAGKKGRVYLHGPQWAGVWLVGRSLKRRVERLRVDFPDLKIMQVGDGELTFRVPISDLGLLLPILDAKKRPVMTKGRLAALKRATAKSAPYRFRRSHGGQRPVPSAG